MTGSSNAGRPEKPINTELAAVAALARELRTQRRRAQLTYRDLADLTQYSVSALRKCAAGQEVPGWLVIQAFVQACGGDEAHTRTLWERARASIGKTLGRTVGETGFRQLDDAVLPSRLPATRAADGLAEVSAALLANVTTIPQFLQALRQLRIMAGNPPLTELNRRSGGFLPPSTVSGALTRDRLPRLELVMAYVRACGADDRQAAQWEALWARMKAGDVPGTDPADQADQADRTDRAVVEPVGRRAVLLTEDAGRPRRQFIGRPRLVHGLSRWTRRRWAMALARWRASSRSRLIWLSGAHPGALARSPADRVRYEGLGAAMLFTALVAGISMTFTLGTAVSVPVPVAVVLGGVWGALVLSLDRWLVSLPRPARSLGRALLLAMPQMIVRVLLATLVGLLISASLVMQIFRTELDARIVSIKTERLNAFTVQQDRGALGREIAALERNVAGLQAVIAADGQAPIDPNADPTIKSLLRERSDEQARADLAYRNWQCELYGGPNCTGSGTRGEGPLAQAAQHAYQTSKARIHDLNDQINARKRVLAENEAQAAPTRLAVAKSELPKAQQRLNDARARQLNLQVAFDRENLNDDGLLIRLQALSDVSTGNTTVAFIRVVLFLLIITVDCLPQVFRLVMAAGPPGSYERLLTMEERTQYILASRTYQYRLSGDRTLLRAPVPGLGKAAIETAASSVTDTDDLAREVLHHVLGLVSKPGEPVVDGGYVDGGLVSDGELVVAGCDGAVAF